MKSPLIELINPSPKKIDSIRHWEIAISCKETRHRYKIDVEIPIADATDPKRLKEILIEKVNFLFGNVK